MAADVIYSSTPSTTARESELRAAPQLSPHDPADFLLHPAEIAKGRRAAENYLSSFKNEESRAKAEEALETLATVISCGKCDSLAFPWQQVRPYHGAAALTMLKAKGAPARVEALLCRRDSTRSYRMVPESYAPRQVQKIRSTLSKLIERCCELGFVSEDDRDANSTATAAAASDATARQSRRAAGAKSTKSTKTLTKTTTRKTAKKSAQGRLLSTGELRALMATCATPANAEGYRDAVFFALVHRGMKIAEITALRLDSVKASAKTGLCTITAKPPSGGRGRRIELTNEELIYLEDWLDFRGDVAGPLLCTLSRGGKVEGKRLTTAILKEICESRGERAEVEPFTPNDLSRSAEALSGHRRALQRKASKKAEAISTAVDGLLFDDVDVDAEADVASEAIVFPFRGLGI